MIKYMVLTMLLIVYSCNKKNDFLNNKASISDTIEKANDDFNYIDFSTANDAVKHDFIETNKNNLSDTILKLYKNYDRLSNDEINKLMLTIEHSKNRYNDLYLYIVYRINNREDIEFPALESSSVYYFDLFVAEPEFFYNYLSTRDSNYKLVLKNHVNNFFGNIQNENSKDSIYQSHKAKFDKEKVEFIFGANK